MTPDELRAANAALRVKLQRALGLVGNLLHELPVSKETKDWYETLALSYVPTDGEGLDLLIELRELRSVAPQHWREGRSCIETAGPYTAPTGTMTITAVTHDGGLKTETE
jgi:hypothetical protein